jgi:hypothetical protein
LGDGDSGSLAKIEATPRGGQTVRVARCYCAISKVSREENTAKSHGAQSCGRSSLWRQRVCSLLGHPLRFQP